MTSKPVRPNAWRRETGDRLKHFQIAETSAKTIDIRRYAARERARSRLAAVKRYLGWALLFVAAMKLLGLLWQTP
jgi:hypothetical protein